MDTSLKQVDPLGGLTLDPSNELRFKGPFDNEYSSVTLTISNPTEKRIAFKIKTTAPKRYCVKPNSGVLDPTRSMKVNVLLQPFNHDPNEKLKHKFMVQYMYLNEEENKLDAQDILNKWKDVSTSRLLDIKLKCLFESDVENQGNKTKNTTSAATVPQVVPQAASSNAATGPTDTSSQINNNNTNDNSSELKSRSTTRVDKTNNQPTATSSAPSTRVNSQSSNDASNSVFESLSSNTTEEEARLKRMAMPSSSQTKRVTTAEPSTTESLVLLLHKKSIWIIVALIAVIIYLLLFK